MVFALAGDSTMTSGLATCVLRGVEGRGRRSVGLGAGHRSGAPSSVLPCARPTCQTVAVRPRPWAVYRARRAAVLAALDFLDPENILDWLGPFATIGLFLDRLRRVGPADRLLPARRLAAVHRRAALVPGQVRPAPPGAPRRLLHRRGRSATRSATCSASASARRCSAGRTRGCSSRSTSHRTKDFFEEPRPEDDRARTLRARRPHVRADPRRRRRDAVPRRSSGSTSSAASSGRSASRPRATCSARRSRASTATCCRSSS